MNTFAPFTEIPCSFTGCNSDRYWLDAYSNVACFEHRPPRVRALVREYLEIWACEDGGWIFQTLEQADELRAAGRKLAPGAPTSPQTSERASDVGDEAAIAAAAAAATKFGPDAPGSCPCPQCGYWRWWHAPDNSLRCYGCQPPESLVGFLRRSLRAYRSHDPAFARRIEGEIRAMAAEIEAAKKFLAEVGSAAARKNSAA